MKKILIISLCFLVFGVTFAQVEELSKEKKVRREKNIQAGNPFAEFGYKAKVATLSKGKYLEVHDLDSIVKIGSSLWHVKKQKIVGNVIQDTTDIYRQPLFETAGRWLSPDPLAEEFPEWSPYNYTLNNPIRYVDPDGRAPVDWIKNRYGDYLWDDNAVDQASTRTGWSYVGKELPQGTHRYSVLTEIDGSLYHKNTTNLFAKVGNFLGGDFVEHKPYDPVTENNLNEGINTGVGFVTGNYVFKGVSSVVAKTFTNNVAKNGLGLTDDFINSAIKTSGKQNQGLSNVGRQLQKHAGRDGAFSNIKFSHKTGNEQGLKVLNEIMGSKNITTKTLRNGTRNVFDQNTGRGFNISRDGLFNGFRELKN